MEQIKFSRMNKTGKPTSAELEILGVLWERGAVTVREVHETLSARKPTLYTTVLKMLQIMHEKGLVERDSSAKAHIYRATVPPDETRKNLVSDLLEKAFRGSALKLVQHVLETKPASAEELAEIRRLITEAEENLEK
jgi:BlaI family transcriptional regulator, penicillinase repressor